VAELTPERQAEVERLFVRAVDLSPEERAGFRNDSQPVKIYATPLVARSFTASLLLFGIRRIRVPQSVCG